MVLASLHSGGVCVCVSESTSAQVSKTHLHLVFVHFSLKKKSNCASTTDPEMVDLSTQREPGRSQQEPGRFPVEVSSDGAGLG